MKIDIADVDSAVDLAELRRNYLASLTAPFDGMWETLASAGRHLELRSDDERAGYVSIDEQGRLLQFHVTEPFARDTDALFRAVLARDDVLGAMVSTADPCFLGACLDHHETLRVHTLLYEDLARPGVEPENGSEAGLEVVGVRELDAIVALQRASLDHDPGTWLVGYLSSRIERRELYALRFDGEIVATGEARVSECQPPFTDLGVITARRHRRHGIATHVLRLLKSGCRERGLVPICSTTVGNVGARKAIENAGFVSRHRILEVGFREA